MQIERNKNYIISLPVLAGIGFVLLCILFQTNNSTIDAYGFAADIKYGENIFRPHHLLYNALGWVLYSVLKDIEPLVLMKTVNALFASGCLVALSAIMRLLKFDSKFVVAALLVAASSFGLLRFATENEVYIIPLFLSLWGTYYFIKYHYHKKISFLICSSILMSIAALFHQMHVIWLLVTAVTYFIGSRRNGIIYSLISVIIIATTYFSVIRYYNNESLSFESVTRFVLYDYYTGEATSSIGFNNLFLTGVNFIRSFIQIHGNIYYLVKTNLIYVLPIIISLVLVFIQIKKYVRRKVDTAATVKPNYTVIKNYILSVFIAQLLFAFYAQGNAEFMVMLPFLLVIYLGFVLGKYQIYFSYLGMAIFVWNLAFGLIPQKYYDLQNKEYLMNHYNPKDIYILSQANLYKNMFYYTNHDNCENIYKTPSDYKSKNQDYIFLDSLIKHSNKLILTDAIGNSNTGTRQAFVSNDFDLRFFHQYTLTPFYTQTNSLNNYQITEVKNGK